MTLRAPLIYNPANQRIDELPAGDLITADLIDGLMGRNRLINGDLRHWQRGTSFASGLSYYAADRWLVQGGSSTIAASRLAIPASQTVIPGNPRAAIRCVVSSVAGAANYATLRQRIEGADTLAGRKATFSFWAKADAARNISVEFCQRVGTAEDVLAIGVNKLALTTSWAKYTVTVDIPVFVASIFGIDYLEMFLWMEAGSSYNARTNSLGQQSGTFDFTMLQLEEGSVATTYDWRPDALELALCQRYYEKSYELGVAPGTVGTEGAVVMFGGASNSSAHQVGTTVSFRVSKRAPPAVTSYSTITGTAARIRELVTATDVNAVLANIGSTGFFNSGTQPSAQTGWNMQFHWTADAEL